MKYCIITMLLMFCYSTLAGGEHEHLEWFNKAQWELSEEIKAADKEHLNELMRRLGELWLQRDGALGSEVAPFIVEVAIKEPSIVFKWFKHHPKDYEGFVQDLQYSVFTDYNGDPELVKQLEMLRVNAITACKSVVTASVSSEASNLAKALESQLLSISVRAID